MATKRGRGEGDLKKKMARLRFKNLVRSVILNKIWLMDVGEQKLSLNVKKNIAMLIRPQRKIGILTMAEKTLLRTHHSLRSIDDRKKLVNLMGSLTCFARIPPKVRARLVPVIKLMVLGPGRKIINEGDPPSTIYFILSGEVELFRRVYDRAKQTYVDKLDLIRGPGDCLGDIEMIEECNRINTYVSRNEVELLVLHEEDFNQILRPTMSRQWLEKKAALQALEYFKYLNRDQIIAACKLGLIRQFDPMETIFYEDRGHLSYVHFVLSGECMILQCLKMKVTSKKGGKTFELVDTCESQGDSLFHDLTTFSSLKISKDMRLKNISSPFDVDYEIMSDEDDANINSNRLLKKMDLKSIDISCGLLTKSDTSGANSRFSKEYLSGNDAPEELSECSELSYTYGINPEYDPKDSTEYLLTSRCQKRTTEFYRQGTSNSTSIDNISCIDLLEIPILFDSLGIKTESQEMKKSMEPLSQKQDSSTKMENHFIEVGSITFGGIFSLGEKAVHRVIMARTTVQCLMLPRYWLFENEQNPGNIWQRRRFYLDSTIPYREQLFKDFLTTCTWQKFKNNAISSNLNRNFGNPTKVQDIPIICRIVEPSEE